MSNSVVGARVVTLMAAAQIEGEKVAQMVARNFTEAELIEGLRHAALCEGILSLTMGALARTLGERCAMTGAP